MTPQAHPAIPYHEPSDITRPIAAEMGVVGSMELDASGNHYQ